MDIIQGSTDIVREPLTKAVINIDTASHETAVADSKTRQCAKEHIKTTPKDNKSNKKE